MQLLNLAAFNLLALCSINSQIVPSCNSNNTEIADPLESIFNAPEAPCEADYWTKKLRGTTRNGQTYSINGKAVITVKREAYLGNCDAITRMYNPDRLIFNFKDDDCIEFDNAECS